MTTLFYFWMNEATPWYYIPPSNKPTFKFALFCDLILTIGGIIMYNL